MLKKSKMFQYVILWHPTEEESKSKNLKSKIVKELTTVLVNDNNAAFIHASREIPQELLTQLDQVEIVISDFR